MNADAYRSFIFGQIGTRAAPCLIVLLAGIAARTSLASTYPTAALLLLLWIVSDAMMLALVASSPGRRPSRQAVIAVLAAASVAVTLASPPALRQALLDMPAMTACMAMIVLAHVAWATARARRAFRSPGLAKERWIAAASEFSSPALARLAAAELSVIHIALFRWGGPADVPADARAYSYHKHLAPMCAALLILSAIEVAVYHLLVGHWSRTAALVMFVLSDVGLIYLVGLIKSFRFRPVLVTPAGVRIRAGFLIDQPIPLASIASVETSFTGTDVRDPATLNAALLAWPNIILRLHEPMDRRSFLRRRAPYSAVAFRLDDPEPFVRLLNWRLGQNDARSCRSLM